MSLRKSSVVFRNAWTICVTNIPGENWIGRRYGNKPNKLSRVPLTGGVTNLTSNFFKIFWSKICSPAAKFLDRSPGKKIFLEMPYQSPSPPEGFNDTLFKSGNWFSNHNSAERNLKMIKNFPIDKRKSQIFTHRNLYFIIRGYRG